MFLESRKVPSSLLCVHLASAPQCYYTIEQWSFYFWLTVDDLALNPWPWILLKCKMSKPAQGSRLRSASQPCLWPRLLQAAKTVGEKQELSQAAVWHPLGGCLWTAWPCAGEPRGAWLAEPPNCWGDRSNCGSQVPTLCSIFFQSTLQCYCISKHGSEKSITVSCVCQHPEMLHELNYLLDLISKCSSSGMVSQVCECAEVK